MFFIGLLAWGLIIYGGCRCVLANEPTDSYEEDNDTNDTNNEEDTEENSLPEEDTEDNDANEDKTPLPTRIPMLRVRTQHSALCKRVHYTAALRQEDEE